ncbi:MAG: LysR family transcriptional regulator [Hyphomicrobiaceae bacterium]|nr:LysR family transcriptional regulator [Hyphomicrobiaceae bacterium]
MLEFRALETFYWVIRLGSFGNAARKLNTTQPAISQRIAAIEEALGGKVVVRGARQVTATPLGRELLVYAEKLLGLRAEMMTRLSGTAPVQGVLRLGVAETLVHTWLPTFIKAVNEAYPKLALEIEVDISPSLRTRLLAQEIELAFLLGPLTASTVRNLSLGHYRLAFLASPSLKLTPRSGLSDLAAHPIFTFSRNTQPYETVRELFRSSDVPPISVNASASLATVVRLATDGLGTALIPPDIVRDEIEAGRLKEVARDVPLPDLKFSASWLDTPDTSAIQLVAALAARMAAEHQAALQKGSRGRRTPAPRAKA